MSDASTTDDLWFIDKQVPGEGGYRVVRKIDSGRNGHVFVAHSDQLGMDVACKVIPLPNLLGQNEDPPRWRSEITNANMVSSPKVVKIFSAGPWSTPRGEYIFLLSDLVRGQSLRNYCKAHRTIELLFVVSLLEELLDFLRELKELHLVHGDLHSGNILVEDRSASLVGPRYAFRITDFGVAPATTGGTPLLDDFEQVALLLRTLLEAVDWHTLLPQDRLLFDFLRDDFLAKKLPERDPLFDSCARNPVGLFEILASGKRASTQSGVSSRRLLTTPFDYLSCEQIGEAHVLLKELYSDKLLGLEEIEDLNNLVLTGPRGCGKTTVFRCLSMKHRVRTQDDALASVRYVGIYYRCDDLYYCFPRFQSPTRSECIDLPMHFLTATLLRELFQSLEMWLPRVAPTTWKHYEQVASKDIWSSLRLSPPTQPSANTFSALIGRLEKERARAAKKQRLVNDATVNFGYHFGPDVLVTVCSLLASYFPELSTRPIFFLIDDYSSPKISSDLQKNLNRLLMYRSPSCFFKLATESPASYESSDIDGKSYVEGREFRLVNLGMDFINAAPADKLKFVDDVFNRRFSYTENFPVKTLKSLVGDDEKSDYNEVARQYRAGRHALVWGRSTLGELCSGDVHFLIDLASKMVAAAGGRDALIDSEAGPAIPPEIQNKAIRTEGGNFLKNLRALPNGQKLVEIVEAFGNVAASYIRHKDSKNETSSPPHQASRIEPLEDPKLSGDAKEIYAELLRYSVFLEDVRGKSRRGLVVPRLYLRRFLIPFFNLTFSKRDNLELSTTDLTELLLDPIRFESRKRLRGPDGGDGDDSQFPLLPTDPER